MSEPEEDAGQEREQEESLARIEAGGIPLSAERRLSELSEPGGSFTSDLSVNGFALCHQLGLKPLSQVMGSSIYQMGYQSSWGATGFGGMGLVELDTLSQALNEVRTRALDRLAASAPTRSSAWKRARANPNWEARAVARSRSSTWCSAPRYVARTLAASSPC